MRSELSAAHASVYEHARWLWRAWRYRLRVEKAEIAILRRRIRSGWTAVDVGAHKGAFTYWMLRATGPTGRVVAFEPQPELAEALTRLQTTRLGRSLTVVPSAVSSAPGTLKLYRPDGRPSPSATVARDAAAAVARADSFPVPVTSLDEYFSQHSGRPVRFIKCDVEGHELDVFRGAETILREDRPFLLFECEQRHHNADIRPVFEFLGGLGYSGRFFFNGGLRELSELPKHNTSQPDQPGYVYNYLFEPAAAARAAPLRRAG